MFACSGYCLSVTTEECEYSIRQKKEDRKKRNFESYGINTEMVNAGFQYLVHNENRREILNFIGDFCARFDNFYSWPINGFYLFGSSGVGKSHLASATCNHQELLGIDTLMVHYPALVREIIESNSEETENKLNVCMPRIRVLDDFGGEHIAEWHLESVVNRILMFREQENLPTIFTSYFSVNDLEDLYLKRTRNRKLVQHIVKKLRRQHVLL
ncbi:hypothetical protein [Risungbinella massiliensis]|uniref:hypothetical protein n=1 Tax=Risungbinella massiliensis TaxID=1329796 RepID=UPI001C9BE49C|nr:hypothetical protein [Risungbinella massiliensis]